jgi:hypothetical protein
MNPQPVAPKNRASIMSFTYPRIRLIKVAKDIMPAALAIFCLSSPPLAGMLFSFGKLLDLPDFLYLADENQRVTGIECHGIRRIEEIFRLF